MQNWLPNLEGRKGPRYIAIADAIGEAIKGGELQGNMRLPTHRDLAYRLGVTVGTISRAYNEAIRRDYIVAEVGRGTYVKTDDDNASNLIITTPNEADVINFGMNTHNDPTSTQCLRQTLKEIADEPALTEMMRYQSHKGLPHHRQAFAQFAQWHGAPQDMERLIITAGAQHAMTISVLSLLKAGDVLLCEEYSYSGIKILASQLGIKMGGVAMDEYGIIPERLEEAIVNSGSRVLYFMPNYQNPTGVTMPLERRMEILKIARKYGLWLIEDDVYSFLSEDAGRIPPFASLIPEQTFYIHGVSKCLSPGLRVAFVMVPQSKLTLAVGCLRLTCGMVSSINIEVVSRWINDGTALKVIRSHRLEARARQQIMRQFLYKKDLSKTHDTFHAWLKLPDKWLAEIFSQRARERNVSIMPSHMFYIGRGQPVNAVRVCFGAPDHRESVTQGMRILFELLSEEIQAFPSIL